LRIAAAQADPASHSEVVASVSPPLDSNASPQAQAAATQSAPANPVDYSATDTTNEPPSVQIGSGNAVSAVPKRFQYALRLNLRTVYDDNIYLQQFDRVGDVYFAIEPGLTIGFGDIVGSDMNSIRIDYAPSFFLYADHSNANSLQHLINLTGAYHMGHLSLSLSENVQILDGTINPGASNFGATATNPTPTLNLDTGGNTSVNIFNTNAGFSYDLTAKTFLSGGMALQAYDYQQQLISSEQLQGNLFINYIYSPKLTAGLGATFGYNWVDGNNPDQSFQQVNVRTTYQVSGKVSLNGSVGVEFREFENDVRGGTYVSPVFELGATYQPFDGTQINLNATRRIQNSAVLAGQDYNQTFINIGIRQRFMRRFYFGLSGGYERSDYFNTVEFVSATRSDDYLFVQPSVDVTLTRFWTAGAYYLHRRDNSSYNAFTFHDNQVGFRTSLTF
jgi:hypothetical protein